jgi:4-hydroxy-3-methylbut-2-enyl diphosphate reductase
MIGHLMQILSCQSLVGFCAGVDRAIAIVNEALTRFIIYVRHEVVHWPNLWSQT